MSALVGCNRIESRLYSTSIPLPLLRGSRIRNGRWQLFWHKAHLSTAFHLGACADTAAVLVFL